MSNTEPLQFYHSGIENVKLFNEHRLHMLRQTGMLYLDNDTNYNFGFNHAWRVLQGAASEKATDRVSANRMMDEITQLRAENSTLEDEVKRLKDALAKAEIPPVKKSRAKPKAPQATGSNDDKTTE